MKTPCAVCGEPTHHSQVCDACAYSWDRSPERAEWQAAFAGPDGFGWVSADGWKGRVPYFGRWVEGARVKYFGAQGEIARAVFGASARSQTDRE